MKGWRSLALAAVCAAMFLCCALPGLEHPGLNHDEALQAAEAVLFLKHAASATQAVSGIGGQGWWLGRYPWMTLDYVGALKTYLVAGAFEAFGVKVSVLRAVTVSCGAACVFFTVLLVQDLYGAFWAALLGAWLASDPALILMARYDSGPFILTLALKMAGLYCLARGSGIGAFLGGILFGLALWDKAHFLWWLFGLAVAAPWLLRRFRTQAPLGKPFLAGLSLGSAPLLLYNLRYPLRTFRPQAGFFPFHFAGIPWVMRQRWDLVRSLLSGSGFFALVSGERAPVLEGRAAAVIVLGLILAAAFIAAWRNGRERLRHAAFWATASAAIFLAASLTPLQVGLHHMPMLYPLPHLAAVSLLWAGARSGHRPLSWGTGLLSILLLALVFQNGRRLRDFHLALSRTRGSPGWYEGLSDVAVYCARRAGPVLTMDLMYATPLVVYTDGEVVPREVYASGAADGAAGEFGAPGGTVVAYSGPETFPDPRSDSRRAFMRLIASRPALLTPWAVIPYSDGGAWTTLYSVARRHGR